MGATLDIFDLRDTGRADEFVPHARPGFPALTGPQLLIDSYEEAHRERPSEAGPHLQFARAALAAGLEREAVRALESYLRLRPDCASGHYLLGLAHAALNSFGRAAVDYGKALLLTPEDPDIAVGLHFSYFHLLRFKEALHALELAEEACVHQKECPVPSYFFSFWRGADLVLTGDAQEAELALSACAGCEGVMLEATHYVLGLAAILRADRLKALEYGSSLESVNSNLLPALSSAKDRGSFDPREVVAALTGYSPVSSF